MNGQKTNDWAPANTYVRQKKQDKAAALTRNMETRAEAQTILQHQSFIKRKDEAKEGDRKFETI